MAQTILVKRIGALGDVLEATAITARLREEDPDHYIDVLTACVPAFKGNPHVNATHQTRETYDRLIDLDGAFESRLRQDHPIDAYSEVAFGDRLTPHKLVFRAEPVVPINYGRMVVLHPARSWPIRTLPHSFWQRLTECLRDHNYDVAITGTHQDWELSECIDYRGRLNLAQQAGLITAACCFICSESGPMILAQATRTPIIPLLTMIPPEHVVHVRAGGPGWRWHPVRANVPCIGCATRQPEETTSFGCIERHYPIPCVASFDPAAIADLVDEVQMPRAG